MSKELTPLKALDHIKTYARLDACKRCQYFKNGNCENNIGECIWKDEINTIEKSLKALEIIQEVFGFEVFEYEGRYYIRSRSGSLSQIRKDLFDLLKEVLK